MQRIEPETLADVKKALNLIECSQEYKDYISIITTWIMLKHHLLPSVIEVYKSNLIEIFYGNRSEINIFVVIYGSNTDIGLGGTRIKPERQGGLGIESEEDAYSIANLISTLILEIGLKNAS